MNNYFGNENEELSLKSIKASTFNSEGLLYENNDPFDNPKSLSELDSVDYQELYFTINNTEKISEKKTPSKEEKKLNLNAINITQRSTSNSLNRSIILQKRKKNEKIFDIKKAKHVGRKRKNEKSTEKPSHTKFTKDNIMVKVKRDVLDSCKDFLNKLLKKTDNTKKKRIYFKKNRYINIKW